MASRSATVDPRLLKDVLRQRLPPAAIKAFDYYSRLRDLEDFVLASIGKPIGRSVAARVACLQPAPFSRYFSAKTGLRFLEWLMMLRVGYATWHLERCDVPLSRLATASGFHDERQLRRAFVRVNGICPRGYRKRLLAAADGRAFPIDVQNPIAATTWPIQATNLTVSERPAGYMSGPQSVVIGVEPTSPDT